MKARTLVRLLVVVSIVLAVPASIFVTRPTAAAQNDPACTPPPSGLVAWWPGDGHTNDIVSANHGSPQRIGFEDGMVGQSFVFTGTDALLVPDHPSLNFEDEITIETWLYLRQSVGDGADNTIIAKLVEQAIPEWRSYWLEISQSSSILPPMPVVVFGVMTGVNSAIGVGHDYAIVDTWTHMAAVRHGDVTRLYMDGSYVGEQRLGSTGYGVGKGPVLIGHLLWGSIDELSLYNRALSTAEIQAIYNTGSAGKCKNADLVLSNSATDPILVFDNLTYKLSRTMVQILQQVCQSLSICRLSEASDEEVLRAQAETEIGVEARHLFVPMLQR